MEAKRDSKLLAREPPHFPTGLATARILAFRRRNWSVTSGFRLPPSADGISEILDELLSPLMPASQAL
jgi:hypothetical protein